MNTGRRTHSPVGNLLRLLTAAALAVAVAAAGCHCGGETEVAAGQSCDEEGQRDGTLICEDGEWVVADSDVGFDDVGESNGCTPESHSDFCDRHGVECGSFEAEDNCGETRLVHCEEFDGFGCEDNETCLYASDYDDLDANSCNCPELGDSPAEQICEFAGAECGTVNAEEVCQDWQGLGDIDCGGCDGDDECGEELDNVCGCPCEIDGQCYGDGDVSADNACLICDPDESEEEFTEAEDGTSCDDFGVCEDGDCVCEDDATTCGDDCVDLDTSRDHCGECDNPCDDNQVCDGGECVEGCPDGHSLCDGQCVNTDTDIDHCGECNTACTTDDDDATASCDAGVCVYQCADDEDTFCDGNCTDTDTDTDHCGACGEECSTDIDGAVADCVDGDCEITCQDDADELCVDEGVCVNTEWSDDHCGECGNECSDTQTCLSGECEGPGGACDDDDDCGPAQQCCDGDCIGNFQQCD